MASQKNSTTASATKSMEHSSTRPHRLPYARMVQNFLVLWLDESMDVDNNDYRHDSIMKLRQVVNTVNTFATVDECIDFVTDIKEDKAFMIISEIFSQIIVPVIQDIAQVSSVYILCENKVELEQWAQQWSKVKGVFTDIKPICEALKQTAYDCDQNMVSISFVKSSNDETAKQNLDQLDPSFMYTKILKEILLTINFEQKHVQEFLIYCREELAGNTVQLKNIDKFEQEYRPHEPIWWYTSEYFLYSTLNRALRVMDVDLIIKMGFFLRDLHQHICKLHSKQYGGKNHSSSIIVYRGQGLSTTDFEQLMKTQGGLLSFNNFLSTSLVRALSFAFAQSNQDSSDTIGVLFEITINPSVSSTSFTSIRDASAYKTEEEILFSMHSVFRIGQVKQLDGSNGLWQIELTLTSDNDLQLLALTKCMSEEIKGSTGWDRLGKLMIKLGHFNKAEELYEILLEQTTDESEKVNIYNSLGGSMQQQAKYIEAVRIYEKAIEISKKTLPPNPDLAGSYNNIGLVYSKMGEYSKALSYYEEALEIQEKILPSNDPRLAAYYNNIGLVYSKVGEYSKALSYYEKDLEISKKTLPPNHPDLANSYNNIGSVFSKMGEYSKAIPYYEKALEISKKTLPPNHPGLANSYNNIGSVCLNMGEYSKAHSYYEKALEISKKILSPNHPDLANFYSNIGLVYSKVGEYSKALLYYEKALEISKKTLPPNHPDLANSYNNIGSVYDNIGEYLKALSYYEKDLDISKKTLPSNHLGLASSYNNIGSVYSNMGEYSKALSYYEEALEIQQKTLSPSHPDLATYHSNIGLAYSKMGEYSKALSYYEKALEIQQKALPSNHPGLASSYNNIGSEFDNMGEYSKALLYHEQALEISNKTLPPSHPHLATSNNNIGSVYFNMGEYSKALPYYEKALEISKKTLPPSHPHLAIYYNNIGGMHYKMKEYSKAVSFNERALDIMQHSVPANHPNLLRLRKNIEILKRKM